MPPGWAGTTHLAQRYQSLTNAPTVSPVPHRYRAGAVCPPTQEHPKAKMYAIYQQPKNPAAFDPHYFNTHVPLAKKIPGLVGYEVTRGDVMGMGGQHAVCLVATLDFASMQAIGADMPSPEAQATAADLANFAGAGVDVMMAETGLV